MVNDPPDTAALTWDIKPGGWQRVAVEPTTGRHFVITRCTDSMFGTSWEIEDCKGPGKRAYLDSSPTLAAAIQECNRRVQDHHRVGRTTGQAVRP